MESYKLIEQHSLIQRPLQQLDDYKVKIDTKGLITKFGYMDTVAMKVKCIDLSKIS